MLQLMRDHCKLDVSDGPTKKVCLERLQEWMQIHVLEPTHPPPKKTKSANDADLIDVGRQLCLQLDASLVSLSLPIHHVIVENQISPLASRMRTLQGMLTQYFIMRHPDAEIHYISSSKKLKEFKASKPCTLCGVGFSGYTCYAFYKSKKGTNYFVTFSSGKVLCYAELV
jgi:hypothetical protein